MFFDSFCIANIVFEILFFQQKMVRLLRGGNVSKKNKTSQDMLYEKQIEIKKVSNKFTQIKISYDSNVHHFNHFVFFNCNGETILFKGF